MRVPLAAEAIWISVAGIAAHVKAGSSNSKTILYSGSSELIVLMNRSKEFLSKVGG